ncbi:MAG: PD40 domain-containing protein, partial [Bacteroidales bacterium]|nr:PD40 domain-containing protein [Bacteroidales bacterium]
MIFVIQPLSAQFYNGSQLSFGKNRVQYQKQNWEYYRTEQFDVYFYPTGKELAEYVLWKAPTEIDEIERMLNYTSTKKIQFIVYNTQSDFRESNFAYDNEDFYNQGGVTNIYGTKVYLYFDGDRTHFDRMLRAGIMNLYAHWVINGTSVGANISSESLLDVPNWYFSGLSSYIGEEWNSTIDAYVKNGILTEKYADFGELSQVDAMYAGHSLWKYVGDRFGKSAIPAILFATRSYRSHERGFYNVTGVPYKQLLIDWYRYYYVLYKKDIKRDKPADDGLLKRPKAKRDYNQFRLSPDGKSYAYVTNEAGKMTIWMCREGDKKPRRIYHRFHKTEDNPDLTFPLLAWHPNGNILGFTIEDAGRCYYYPYNIEEKKCEKRLLVDVEKITDISFDTDGKLLLFSGFQHGQSDIFVYSLRARSFQNLTNDFYDDYAPRFINNNKQIVFSSNRPDNQLHPKEHFDQLSPQSNYDLFMYDYSTKSPEL